MAQLAGEKGQFLFDRFLVVDIGAGADPAGQLAGDIEKRRTPRDEPAVISLAIADAIFHIVDTLAFDRRRPDLARALAVVGMDELQPARPEGFLGRLSGIIAPRLVEVVRHAHGIRGPDELGEGIGQIGKLLFELDDARMIALFALLRLCLQPLLLAERHDRLRQRFQRGKLFLAKRRARA